MKYLSLKTSFTIAILLAISSISTAQDRFIDKLKLNGATNFGSFDFKSETQSFDVNFSYGLGSFVGLDYELIATDQLTIETGLSFSNILSSVNQPEVGLEIDYKTNWVGSQLEVNYQVLPNTLFVGAGIFADYAIGGTQQSKGGRKIDLFKPYNGGDPPLNSLNYGLTGRICYSLPSTSFADDVYVAYRLGLPSIEGSDGKTQTTKTKMIILGFRTKLNNLF